jgi:hypothetical protein
MAAGPTARSVAFCHSPYILVTLGNNTASSPGCTVPGFRSMPSRGRLPAPDESEGPGEPVSCVKCGGDGRIRTGE